MNRAVGLVLAFGLLTVSSFVQAEGSFAEQARAVLESAYAADQPGAAVVVSRDGEVLFEGAVGMADLELGVSLQPDHVFRLASVTKQYAAATLLSLVESGEVALDDPLSKYLPDFPVGEVTITQLLNHTSGIKSYTGIEGYMGSERIRADLSTEALVAVFADEPVDFAPGERFAYNNSGYVLVGAVIEAVTGQPWNEVLRERLLLPNGIDRTDAYGDSELVPGRVEGYTGTGDSLSPAPMLSMTQPHAAGALLATAADVDRWQRALHGGRVLNAELHSRMITPEGAAVEANYGFGIVVQEWQGQPALTHGGGIFGFSTQALYLPETRLSVVVLNNTDSPDWSAQDMSLRLAALALDRAYPLEEEAVEWSSEQLAALQGTYRINETEVRTLVVEEAALISQRNGGRPFTVQPIADDRLRFDRSLSWFSIERDEAGRVVAVALHSGWGGEPERAEKISDEVQTRQAIEVPVAQLERLIGDYELMPGFIMSARVNEGQLEIQATGQPAIRMDAESPTRFFSTQVGADITFELPETGPASSLTLFQGGQEMQAPRVEADPGSE
ncbi:serine hydrolase [Wenzhouxiangella marina]|uniref:Serine-type D-Ala-D-Ala carboxypeptidase n=1 Tax=Wenzhouxiangella marina TaxID=1579979 RepID=A0A0K0XZ90_9GAMM|nr:serine hydrolase [Wenzhouxiangella marina]AKS43004.1 Serine-type D-Ala-D-Ala carboxypeptidase [Wenzhouxiangella marina]MBB6087313.1 CubicO group peptidase (beta-lactamase class C family) [Wenzhouxiangella marina]